MFILRLNDMRASQIEIINPRAVAHTAEALEKLLVDEKVQSYQDGQWSKAYRQGGPLEWCNEPMASFGPHIISIGTEDEWAAEARRDFQNLIHSVPMVQG